MAQIEKLTLDFQNCNWKEIRTFVLNGHIK